MKKMKRIISVLLIFIIIATTLSGCFALPGADGYKRVNFYVDGEPYASRSVASGSVIPMPNEPIKENHIFVGWYTDSIFSTEFDFSTPIYTNINLHAKFVLDAVSVTNMATFELMHSVVTVNNKCYNSGVLGMEVESATSLGSGVVIDISGGWCYVLTNQHVVEAYEGFEKQEFTVEDAWGNVFEAKIFEKKNGPGPAVDENYDLALLCFKYSPEDPDEMLKELLFGDDPEVGEYIISLGSPDGQKNSISYGQVLDYRKIDTQDGSKVNFDIVFHNATISHGSSGGPIVSPDGSLAGINFAGYENGSYGCAIPMSKVLEFLNIYAY